MRIEWAPTFEIAALVLFGLRFGVGRRLFRFAVNRSSDVRFGLLCFGRARSQRMDLDLKVGNFSHAHAYTRGIDYPTLKFVHFFRQVAVACIAVGTLAL